jgi:Super-infection exclusion protein B
VSGFDSKWLDLIRATGWQALALSIATGLFLFLTPSDAIPASLEFLTVFVWLVFFLSSSLALTTALRSFFEFFEIGAHIKKNLSRRKARKEVREYIPFMNEDEKKIIAYLLHNNQQSFRCAADGGYASTLLGRGIIVPAMLEGQEYSSDDMPVTVLPHIWDELEKHRSYFPYEKPPEGEIEGYPWRVPWTLR